MKLHTKIIISIVSAYLLFVGGYYGIKNIKGKAEIVEYKKNMRTALKQIGGAKSYITLEDETLMKMYPHLYLNKNRIKFWKNLLKLFNDTLENKITMHVKHKGLYDKDHDLKFLEARYEDALEDYTKFLKNFEAILSKYDNKELKGMNKELKRLTTKDKQKHYSKELKRADKRANKKIERILEEIEEKVQQKTAKEGGK